MSEQFLRRAELSVAKRRMAQGLLLFAGMVPPTVLVDAMPRYYAAGVGLPTLAATLLLWKVGAAEFMQGSKEYIDAKTEMRKDEIRARFNMPGDIE